MAWAAGPHHQPGVCLGCSSVGGVTMNAGTSYDDTITDDAQHRCARSSPDWRICIYRWTTTEWATAHRR